MNIPQITESFYENVYKIQEELQSITKEVQLIVDHTGAYLVAENSVTRIERPTTGDTLLPYAMDAVTALEESHDLTKAVHDQDIEGLAIIAVNPASGNGQRINAYRRLGNYIHDAQTRQTATAVKQELQKRSQQNGPRMYQISLRIWTLFQEIGMPHTRKFCRITPDWTYKLPRSEFERFLQLCETLNSQVMGETINGVLWSQELPFEGGNI
jgi:hypothetical protein